MIDELFEGIYEACSGYGLGHFVWCPVPHLEEVPRILEVERASSEEHFASKFQITQLTRSHFTSKQKLPIKALSLGDTEELLISKAKRRPCIIVACNNTIFNDDKSVSELKGRKHLQDESMLLAPIYGTATPEDEQGFPPIMVARIKSFLYDQFFYLPVCCPKTKLRFTKNGVIRLDRIFPAAPNRGVSPMDFKLSDEPLTLLIEQLQVRLGGKSNDNLKTVKEILIDQLPEEVRPK